MAILVGFVPVIIDLALSDTVLYISYVKVDTIVPEYDGSVTSTITGDIV